MTRPSVAPLPKAAVILLTKNAPAANLIPSSGVQCSGRIRTSDSGSREQAMALITGGSINRGSAAWVIAAIVIFFGLSIVLGSWYTVDQTQRGVLLRNGAFVDVVQPGLHFKIPWFETIAKIDMQTHNFTFDKVNSYSADQQPADLRISVTLHVAPDKVAEMYSRFGGDQQAAISRLITPHMNQEVKVVFGQYTAAKAITARGQLNVDAAKALTDAIAYDPIFVIEGVQIEDIE